MKVKIINIIVASLLVVISLVFALILFVNSRHEYNNPLVVVTINNEVVYQNSLKNNTTYLIKSQYGENLLVIEDGCAYISEATCKDHICINMGKLHAYDNIKSIICLPNKVSVRIENGK